MPDKNIEQAKFHADKIHEELKTKFIETKTKINETAKQLELEQRDIRFTQQMEKFQQSRYNITQGSDGKERSEYDWAVALRKAKEACSAETSAYNSEWRIAMLGLVALLCELNKAVDNSTKELMKSTMLSLQYKILPAIWDQISPHKNNYDIVLPKLLHEVKLDDKNVLKVNLTVKNGSSPNELDTHFKLIVIEWLENRGYIPHPDPAKNDQFVNAETGETLTKEIFEDLKKHPVNGLEQFLTKVSDLEFENRNSPGMSM